MEKLIELLNEYEELTDAEECEKRCIDEYDRISEGGRRAQGTNTWICSKKFGFIKWLVDNDKIDKEFEDKKFLGDIFDSGYRYNNDLIEDRLLCYLALTNEPIKFLISILR